MQRRTTDDTWEWLADSPKCPACLRANFEWVHRITMIHHCYLCPVLRSSFPPCPLRSFSYPYSTPDCANRLLWVQRIFVRQSRPSRSQVSPITCTSTRMGTSRVASLCATSSTAHSYTSLTTTTGNQPPARFHSFTPPVLSVLRLFKGPFSILCSFSEKSSIRLKKNTDSPALYIITSGFSHFSQVTRSNHHSQFVW